LGSVGSIFIRVIPAIDIGSRCLLYCYTMGSDLSQPTSTSLFPTTSRFVPVAKEFLCVMCSFSIDSIQSTSNYSLRAFAQRVTCLVSYASFSTAVFLNWPANLMCCYMPFMCCYILPLGNHVTNLPPQSLQIILPVCGPDSSLTTCQLCFSWMPSLICLLEFLFSCHLLSKPFLGSLK